MPHTAIDQRRSNLVQTTDDLFQRAMELVNSRSWLTPTGLVVPQAMPPDEEEALTIHLAKVGDTVRWSRGDWALYWRAKLDREANRKGWTYAYKRERLMQTMEDLADMMGVETSTLYSEASTCSAWPKEARLCGAVVGYTHHSLLPGYLPIEERITHLREAEDGELSVREFAAYLHASRQANQSFVAKQMTEISPPEFAPPAVLDYFTHYNWAIRQPTRSQVQIDGPEGSIVIRAILIDGRAELETEVI